MSVLIFNALNNYNAIKINKMLIKYLKSINKNLIRKYFILNYTIQNSYSYSLAFINEKIIINNVEINISL